MKILIEKIKDWGLSLKENDSQESYLLGTFLLYEIGKSSIQSYRGYMLDPNDLGGGGNEICYDKEGNDIYLYDFLLGEDYDKGPCFKISISDFLDLLNQWEQAINSNPDVIIITKENDKFIINYQKNS